MHKHEEYISENIVLMSHVPGSVKAHPENNHAGVTTHEKVPVEQVLHYRSTAPTCGSMAMLR